MLITAKRLLLGLGLLLVSILALIFVLENPQPIHLVFLGSSSAELPIAALLATAFILGAAICLLFNIWLLGRLRLRIARQQRELRSYRK